MSTNAEVVKKWFEDAIENEEIRQHRRTTIIDEIDIQALIKALDENTDKYKQFYDHIKAHLEKEHPDWKVCCKICNKTFDEITGTSGRDKK